MGIKPSATTKLRADPAVGPSDFNSTAIPRSLRRFDPSLSLAAFTLAVRAASASRIPTGVISLGLTGVTAVFWLLLRAGGAVGNYRRRLCFLDEHLAAMCSRAGRLSVQPLFVEHKAAMSLAGLVYRIRRQKRLHDVQLIIVADAQRLKVSTSSRLPTEIVQERLAQLSCELDLVILLFETDSSV